MSSQPYSDTAPTREAIEAERGLLLLDFGTDWCGHCRAASAVVDTWIAAHRGVRHQRVEDGRGRPLGRSFAVKLWPSLVLLRDGVEIARVVRPRDARELEPLGEALADLRDDPAA
ncbi:MAG: thioredoxin [Lysobacteraceae bacterium]|nr:MAG: thioredoxin [Xanthomonadaceae bacterium]